MTLYYLPTNEFPTQSVTLTFHVPTGALINEFRAF